MNSRGFTLIELLVVISIISMLSSILLANLNSTRVKANNTYTIQTLHQYIIGLNQFVIDNNRLPDPSPLSDNTDPGAYCLGSPACLSTGGNVENAKLNSELLTTMSALPNIMSKPLATFTSTIFLKGMLYQCQNGSAVVCKEALLIFTIEGQGQNCASFIPAFLQSPLHITGSLSRYGNTQCSAYIYAQ